MDSRKIIKILKQNGWIEVAKVGSPILNSGIRIKKGGLLFLTQRKTSPLEP
jgi:hypothetical protein